MRKVAVLGAATGRPPLLLSAVMATATWSRDQVLGCLMGGAIGDAVGGIDERGVLSLSDDTQLTLATCESYVTLGRFDPAHLASTFLAWFRARRITGIGSSTLKAFRDLEAGAHWAMSGARGEMAAGNGAAMRIAPLAFAVDGRSQRELIRDVARITHHNDEAYCGALAVLLAIQAPRGLSAAELLGTVAEQLPDSRTRDRLGEVAAAATGSVREIAARFGTTGYVVDTVPLALFAASAMIEGGFQESISALVAAGGDTDTIASIAGQVAGAHLGSNALPLDLLASLADATLVEGIADAFATRLGAR